MEDSARFLKEEHEMQMKVWESQLEKDRLWKAEHELRMEVLRKQLEVLSEYSSAARRPLPVPVVSPTMESDYTFLPTYQDRF